MSGSANITLPENSEAHWAWLAGILDGEGSFFVNAKRGYASISVGMKDEDIIRRAADVMGCKRIWLANNRSHKNMWRCALQGQRALLVMERIYPWLGTRRRAKVDWIREKVKSLPGPVHGERSPLARLTANDVMEIRSLSSGGAM